MPNSITALGVTLPQKTTTLQKPTQTADPVPSSIKKEQISASAAPPPASAPSAAQTKQSRSDTSHVRTKTPTVIFLEKLSTGSIFSSCVSLFYLP